MSRRAAPPVPAVDLFGDDRGLASLAGEWDAMLADSPLETPFLTWPWVSAWRETLGRDAELLVAAARHPHDGRLLGIGPFAIRRVTRAGIPHRVLGFVGSGPAAPDHLDLIVAPGFEETVAPGLWNAVRRAARADLFDFDGTRDGSLLAGVAARRREDRARIEAIPCPYLALPATWEEFEAGLGSNMRQNIRRYARKMDREAGAPVVARMVTAADEVDETITALGILHQRVREANGQPGVFRTPLLQAFHHAAARRFHSTGRLRLHRLDVGGEIAAAIYCIRHRDTVSFYTTGYDDRWRRYGPGRRIMAHAIASAIDEGASEFDFLRGDEAYKASWGTVSRTDRRIRVADSARGRTLVLLRRMGKAAQRLRRS